MSVKVIPPGSDHETQITASVLYGLVYGILGIGESEIRSQFNYQGAEIEHAPDGSPLSVIFTGLKVKMASGDYRIRIERESVR